MGSIFSKILRNGLMLGLCSVLLNVAPFCQQTSRIISENSSEENFPVECHAEKEIKGIARVPSMRRTIAAKPVIVKISFPLKAKLTSAPACAPPFLKLTAFKHQRLRNGLGRSLLV